VTAARAARCSGAAALLAATALAGLVASCGVGRVGSGDASPEVVVYTSLDQTFSEEILGRFEDETGIRVHAVYDTEAAKTTGLANRILVERQRPRADVFWNSEIVRTLVLERRGALAVYRSPAAQGIPDRFKDPDGHWTGFAARLRVLVVNTRAVPEGDWPHSILDLTAPRWRGRVALANPLFGTTATQAAALFATLGAPRALAYYRALADNDVAIVAGNATSKDRVAAGEMAVGFTDSDDVFLALDRGLPVQMIFPDQEEGGLGTLLIPNTVALVAGAPHPEQGRRLIDYLLSADTERRLAFARGRQIPLRPGVERPAGVPDPATLRLMSVDYDALVDHLDESSGALRELFLD